jgi:hypothetical protein
MATLMLGNRGGSGCSETDRSSLGEASDDTEVAADGPALLRRHARQPAELAATLTIAAISYGCAHYEHGLDVAGGAKFLAEPVVLGELLLDRHEHLVLRDCGHPVADQFDSPVPLPLGCQRDHVPASG